MIFYLTLKQYPFLQRKSPRHYVGQYIETLKLFSLCLDVALNPALLERSSRKNFPPLECEAKLVTVMNQSVPRSPATFSAFFQAKHFFFLTSWKYWRLPIWLTTLNPKGYTSKYRYRKGLDVVCTYVTGVKPNARKRFPHEMSAAVLILLCLQKIKCRNSIVKFCLVWLNQLIRLHPPLNLTDSYEKALY